LSRFLRRWRAFLAFCRGGKSLDKHLASGSKALFALNAPISDRCRSNPYYRERLLTDMCLSYMNEPRLPPTARHLRDLPITAQRLALAARTVLFWRAPFTRATILLNPSNFTFLRRLLRERKAHPRLSAEARHAASPRRRGAAAFPCADRLCGSSSGGLAAIDEELDIETPGAIPRHASEVVLLFRKCLRLSLDASGLGFMPLISSVLCQSMRHRAFVFQARYVAAQRYKIRSSCRSRVWLGGSPAIRAYSQPPA
jgi:hypothetical protein